MAHVRSLTLLQDAMDAELAWRIKEIKAFEVESSRGGEKSKAFRRAGVALLYAHWEGFIKRSAELYLEYVSSRGLKYDELKTCFVIFGFKEQLGTLISSKKSTPNVVALDFIRESMGQVANLKLSGAVKTESNLSSIVFENIANSVGVSTKPYATRFKLIDSSLVDRRNKIAHGEFLDLKSGDFGPLVDEILDLMGGFKIDLLNAATTQAYKKGI